MRTGPKRRTDLTRDLPASMFLSILRTLFDVFTLQVGVRNPDAKAYLV